MRTADRSARYRRIWHTFFRCRYFLPQKCYTPFSISYSQNICGTF